MLVDSGWTPPRSGEERAVAGGAPGSAQRALALLQEWLADERLAASRLVFLTAGAVAAGPEEAVSDLASAPLWGLVRSAQSENPERFVLVDVDREGPLAGLLGTALGAGEPQLALRGERFSRPGSRG